jgi:beta-lactamase regulating signal transducer with metallopeptidase domain
MKTFGQICEWIGVIGVIGSLIGIIVFIIYRKFDKKKNDELFTTHKEEGFLK